jgi:hypothetical protein
MFERSTDPLLETLRRHLSAASRRVEQRKRSGRRVLEHRLAHRLGVGRDLLFDARRGGRVTGPP